MILVRKVDSYARAGEFVKEVFELFNPEFEEEVIVKPNFLKFSDPSEGCITHPEVVKAVAVELKKRGYGVTIAEGGFYREDADKCFDEFGLREYGKCININTHKLVKVDINGEALKSVEAGEIMLEAMKKPFISLPKMKVHTLATVTLGIKNNMGFLKKPASYMHVRINQKLVDLLKVLNPKFVIADGVIGGANSEMNTEPVKHGVMVAGDNVVEVDMVCAYLMGFEPESIGHLRKAGEEFKVRFDKIEVEGDDIESLRVSYRRNFLGKIANKFAW